jgi:RNA polymerase sigma-70 factor (ECF subfamily)
MQSTLDIGSRVLEHPLVTEAQAGPHDSDVTFVRAAQQGDTEAFGQLYKRYARMVHGILLGRVRHVEVEDLVQEVFLRALPRVRELRDTSRFGSWLDSIARNLATDYYRRSQARPERPHEASDPDDQPAKLNVSSNREAAEILDCIRNLPEAYRETLILRLVEGMTGPEIAAKTGLSPGSVPALLSGDHETLGKYGRFVDPIVENIFTSQADPSHTERLRQAANAYNRWRFASSGASSNIP